MVFTLCLFPGYLRGWMGASKVPKDVETNGTEWRGSRHAERPPERSLGPQCWSSASELKNERKRGISHIITKTSRCNASSIIRSWIIISCLSVSVSNLYIDVLYFVPVFLWNITHCTKWIPQTLLVRLGFLLASWGLVWLAPSRHNIENACVEDINILTSVLATFKLVGFQTMDKILCAEQNPNYMWAFQSRHMESPREDALSSAFCLIS